MAKRQIIEIDRTKCNGCGLCTHACAEEAIQLDKENKAILVKEIYCDGLGACLNVCPTGALKIVTRESADYDPEATYDYVKNNSGLEKARKVHGVTESYQPGPAANQQANAPSHEVPLSVLTNWPVQLQLVNPAAPCFNNCNLLISADCTAYAYRNFHQDFLKSKVGIIACPKLDNTSSYLSKLIDILGNHNVKSVTIVIMAVPCCSGLYALVAEAVERSGKNLPVKKIVVNLDGTLQA